MQVVVIKDDVLSDTGGGRLYTENTNKTLADTLTAVTLLITQRSCFNKQTDDSEFKELNFPGFSASGSAAVRNWRSFVIQLYDAVKLLELQADGQRVCS